MPKAHRHGDSRFCGASTIVEGQSTVKIEGQLWAVLDDPNSHGDGRLFNVVGTTVKIEGKPVIVIGDKATVDGLDHPTGATDPSGSSGTVSAY